MTSDNVDLRSLALETLLDFEKTNIKLSDAIWNTLKKNETLSKDKRSFFTRLTEGTVEQQILLDYIIGQYSSRPAGKLKPTIRIILRLALYQIREMDSVPESAAVNEAVKLTAKKGFSGLKGFVNGVLRNAIRHPEKAELGAIKDKEKYISIKYSMPEFLVKQWSALYGYDMTETICASFLEDKKTTVRFRGTASEAEKFVLSLETDGAQVEKAPYLEYAYLLSGYDRLTELTAFKNGSIAVQDVSSMLCVEAAGIKNGDKVIDVCAAPGGKSVFAADKAENNGEVIARDISEKKLRLIKENAERCGIKNMRIELWDAAIPDDRVNEYADVVIVDAPCSGYGVIGKKPDIKYGASEDKQNALAAIQRKILKTASAYVKKGGRLVYSTCTVSKQENEEIVAEFLNNSDFEGVDFTENMPGELAEKKPTVKSGYMQLLPGIDGCDGFFIAVFRRRS